jgi:hypothetical protein
VQGLEPGVPVVRVQVVMAVQGLVLVVQVVRVQGLAVLVAGVLGYVGVQERVMGRLQIACRTTKQQERKWHIL